MTVYRIQDKEGRGPYKPGFSHRWTDDTIDPAKRPSIMEEFGWDICKKAGANQSVGCAFRDMTQLRRWFTAEEIKKLYGFGYAITKMEADAILGESEKQLVIARNKPLHSGVKRLLLISAPEHFPPI